MWKARRGKGKEVWLLVGQREVGGGRSSGDSKLGLAMNGGSIHALARSEEGSEQRRERVSEGEGKAQAQRHDREGGACGSVTRQWWGWLAHGGHISISSDR